MTLENLVNYLRSFCQLEDLGITLYAILKDDVNNPKKLDIEGTHLPELLSLFLQSIKDTIVLNNDLSLLQFSSADERINAIYEYDIDIPTDLNSVDSSMLHDRLDVFSFANDDLGELKAILIKIGNNQQQVVLYKAIPPINIFSRSNYFLVRKSTTRFEKNDAEFLRISSGYQLIKVDGSLIVLDLSMVEKMFGFHEIIRKEANKGIEAVSAINLLENIEVLTEAAEDISFARKLSKIANASRVLQAGIPNEHIIAFCETFPKLKGKIRFNTDKSKIVLDTKVSQKLFVGLLMDNYLVSQLTSSYYDSVAKDLIETS